MTTTSPKPVTASAPAKRPTPTAFPYRETMKHPVVRRARKLAKGLTGKDIFPTTEQIEAFCGDMYHSDPVAERFVDEVFHGAIGSEAGRAMLKQALDHGIGRVESPPEAMVELFREFEDVPEWVDPEIVEAGAQVWRRWGTFLFSVAGGETLEMYTEAAVATPLSLAGGYAGDNALRRFLETAKFWIDVSQPHALLTPGSQGRATAMMVRVMHVAVRRGVAKHPEWDESRWGYPISQAYQLLTLAGGSVVPALALWGVGVQTTRGEINSLIHFQRYMGYLLGIRNTWYPETIADTLRLLALVSATRSHDAGEHGAELIESFPRAFAPRKGHTGLQRVREQYNGAIYAAYSRLFMFPTTYARYDMPNALPGIAWIVLRYPLVFAIETLRRVPVIGRVHEKWMVAHRENWYRAQMADREAEFNASGALRR